MDKIREAFQKIKKDILLINSEIESLKNEIKEIKQQILKIQSTNNTMNLPTHPFLYPTHHKKIPTQKLGEEALNRLNFDISTRNKGVPTDRQTNRQTDKSLQEKPYFNDSAENLIENLMEKEIFRDYNKYNEAEKKQREEKVVPNEFNEFDEALKILNSLDRVRKEIRKKFKRLTKQEYKVFTTLYLLENQGILADYKILAIKLNLSESSIRDYIGKLIKKGIPITKEKINNKQIILHIDKDLKKIASLETIEKLRYL